MAKKSEKNKNKEMSLRNTLATFDLKKFESWLFKEKPLIWKNFHNATEEVKMGTMCKMICDRTDMLATDAHKKACKWLKDHNMKRRMF